MPVETIGELENIFARTEQGTDVFIYGFKGDEIWTKEIISALLENFLIAIHRDKLRLKVQGAELNKNNLRGFVDSANVGNYHKILTGDGDIKSFEEDFHGMGKFKLRVLLDAQANRKVLIVRKNGMKLFELDRFPRAIMFTGILELDGRELNEFFREMETPSHDKWESGRYEKNPKLAEKYLQELKRWTRDKISSIGAENKMTFELQEDVNYALGVAVYENR